MRLDAINYSRCRSGWIICIVSCGGDVVAALLGCEGAEGVLDRLSEFGECACGGRAQQRLELGKGLFDWVEVRRVEREGEQPRAGRLDGIPHAGDLVGTEVVQDHRVARLQDRNQDVRDIGPEAVAVGGSVEEGGGDEAARA